ncbi:EF-hand domain-containing protein [Roseateles asaccharophilus]|uniref:EF-hand domain-containing protein n=1 Tax=Roseateles asaccharophilus TaxID=582607 RepID=A0ABU2A7Y1_9BURK|nr:EF-hand domain-containing protein [Roseateles asaccharophilus]MDR7333271.1 hypothetical protein [Roseateles asaccharophilus]
MAITVNSNNTTSAAAAGTALRQAERPDSERAFEALDSDGKGYLTVQDLQAVVVRISSAGAQRAEADDAPAAPSAEETLARLDGDGKGQVTRQEFEAAEPRPAPAQDATRAGGASTAAPQAAPSGGGAAGAPSATSASSINQTYEPADTDEDGQVSAREQQAYDARLAAEKAAAQTAGSSRNVEADAAVKAYAAIEQLSRGPAAS